MINREKTMEKEVNEKEFVLLKGSGSLKGFVTPDIPANLPALGDVIGVIFNLPIYADVKGILALLGVEGDKTSTNVLKGFLNKLEFKQAEKKVGVQIDMQIVALDKEDGNVDIAIHVATSFQTAYSQSLRGYHPKRSLYQDQVRFRIWPKDPSQIDINHRGSMPKTEMKEVTYSNSATWNTKVGFTGEVGIAADKIGGKIGVSGEHGYSFSISAGTKTKDFDMAKISEGQTDTLGWISQMRSLNATGTKHPMPKGYNPDDPYSLVANGAFTKWLNDPPGAAQSDLDLEFLAAYSGLDPSIKNEVVEFEFTTTQRLMHAEIVGRWGIPGAEVGGVTVIILKNRRRISNCCYK